jgi:hypothetical protein
VSPDGDGNDESVASYYCLSEAANVTVAVVPDGGGSPVRMLASGVSKPATSRSSRCEYNGSTWSWSWDGKTDAGVVAGDGRYRVVVSATDAQGDTDAVEFLVELDTAAVGTVESPVATSTLSGTVEVRFAPVEGRTITYMDTNYTSSVSGAGPDGKWRVDWDTTATSDGAKTLTVTVRFRDSFGLERYKGYSVPGSTDVAGGAPRAHAVRSVASELSMNVSEEETACASARYSRRSWGSPARS